MRSQEDHEKWCRRGDWLDDTKQIVICIVLLITGAGIATAIGSIALLLILQLLT